MVTEVYECCIQWEGSRNIHVITSGGVVVLAITKLCSYDYVNVGIDDYKFCYAVDSHVISSQ